MPYGLPSAPVRRSRTPSSRQYAGSLSGAAGGPPARPAGGVDPSANHSALVIVSATPGICRLVSAVHAAASRLVWAPAGTAATSVAIATTGSVIRMVRDYRARDGQGGGWTASISTHR